MLQCGMTYWLSRAGATQAEGPYTPRQIQTMWSNGRITAEDQLCPTDVEDGWLPAEMVVEELEERAEEKKRRSADDERRQEMMRRQAHEDYERRKKSPVVGLLLSLLLPGLGHGYAGAPVTGAVFFILMILLWAWVGYLSLLFTVVIAALAPAAVERCNARLAKELGLL